MARVSLKIFYVLFVIAFFPVVLISVFNSPVDMRAGPLLLFIIVVAACMVGVWRYLPRLRITERHAWVILCAYMVLAAAVQLFFGYLLRFTPIYDFYALFEGGRLWALTGSIDHPSRFHGTHTEYFATFQNQWGALFLFRCLFGAYNIIGGGNFHNIALVYNVLMLQVMVFCVFYTAKELGGTRAALYALCLIALFPPFYFMGAVYYTDALSMPFIAAAAAVYVRTKSVTCVKRKIALFALCGAIIAVGAAIKMTVLVLLVAIVIDGILYKEKYIAVAAAVAILLLGGFNLYMRTVISPEMSDRYRMPPMFWVMMGTQNYGRFVHADFVLVREIPDYATRRREVGRIAFERYREMGVGESVRIMGIKSAINFGDGTFQLWRFLDDDPLRETRLHSFAIREGRFFGRYAHAVTGLSLAMLVLAMAGAGVLFFKGGGFVVPLLSLFGLLLLLAFWESGARLVMGFFPMLVLAAVQGAGAVNPVKTTGAAPGCK